MFKIDFEVRDNEIDVQGVVNNANYFIYMAHTRHQFLRSMGIDFTAMAKENQMLFLISTDIQFKKPLKPNDRFYVTCKLRAEGKIRFAFEQEVRKHHENILCAQAVNIGVCLNGNNRNRPYIPDVIKETFDDV